MNNQKSIFNIITDLIFPSHLYCICCGSIINKTRTYGICDDCMEKINWVKDRTCSRCGKILNENYYRDICADCMETERSFDKGYTCMRYSLYERRILADFKFNGKDYIADYLGKMLADRMSYEKEKPDIVTSVPAHKSREKKRGYNQAELLARKYAYYSSSGFLPYYNLLNRTRVTKPMKNLSKMQRYDNVHGAFTVNPGMHKYIENKNIAIVDDIFTTGSTLDECSRVLKEAGASRVIIVTVSAGANIPPKENC